MPVVTAEQREILGFLIEDVARNSDRFDEETGRFLTGDGWAVTNQDLIFSLALLYVTDSPDNPYHADTRILHLAERGGDAWRDFQNPDGTVEFVKVDGSTWGPIFMPWSMYHWLEAFALLQEDLHPERRKRWREGLTLAYTGIAAGLESADVHNIPAWNGMALYRAGVLFAREEWCRNGRRMMTRTAEAQEPEGYWKEHGGPTPFYNLVYVHALGLYYSFSKDDSVLPAIEKATDFHTRYTYPDGTCIETVDGRVKYHDSVPEYALAAFSLSPRGRRFARLLLRQMRRQRLDRSEPRVIRVKTSRSIKISAVEYGLNPRLASAYLHWTDGPEEMIELDKSEYRTGDPGIGVVRRSAGWVYCLSEFVLPPVSERWGQDRQNFLSVWHEKAGLIIGCGNSKDQPEWSSFSIGEGDARCYIPDSAAADRLELGDRLRLGFGGVHCALSVAILDTKRLEILMEAHGTQSATGRLLFRLAPGQPLATANGGEMSVTERAILLSAQRTGAWFESGACRVHLPDGAEVCWPVYPFNPYTSDGAAPLESAVAVLSVALHANPVKVILEMTD